MCDRYKNDVGSHQQKYLRSIIIASKTLFASFTYNSENIVQNFESFLTLHSSATYIIQYVAWENICRNSLRGQQSFVSYGNAKSNIRNFFSISSVVSVWLTNLFQLWCAHLLEFLCFFTSFVMFFMVYMRSDIPTKETISSETQMQARHPPTNFNGMVFGIENCSRNINTYLLRTFDFSFLQP